MAEPKYVSAEAFSQLLSDYLTISGALMELLMTLKTALHDNNVITRYQFETAAQKVHNSPRFVKMREGLAKSTRSIQDILEGYEGPVQ